MELMRSEYPQIRRIVSVMEYSSHAGDKAFYPRDGFGELVYYVTGETWNYWKGGSVLTREGWAELLAPELDYGVEAHADTRCIDIYFECGDEYPPGITVYDLSGDPRAAGLFRDVLSRWTSRSAGYYAACMSDLYGIIGRIQRGLVPGTARSARLAPAVELLRRSVASPELRMEELAEACGMGYSAFRHSFREEFGVSAGTYLTQLRLERAKELLLSGRYSVGETAEMTGFSDIYYFSRTFRRVTGITPTEYRKQGGRTKNG